MTKTPKNPDDIIAAETILTQRLAISLAADEDPVTAAERALGVGRNQLDPATELALVVRYNELKQDKAEWENDTHLGMKWDYFLGVLQEQGFEQAYAHNFQESWRNNTEEFGIWIRRDKGYLVSADSYWHKDAVNSANLYYELALPAPYESLTEEQHRSLVRIRFQGSSVPLEANGSMVGYLNIKDGRDGLVKYLQELESSGLSTHVPWRNVLPRELWYVRLYDFEDAKIQEAEAFRDNMIIKNKRTLDKLPKDVQEMLGWIA